MNEYLIPKACFRKPNGILLSAEEFLKKAGNNYKENHIHPYCPECNEKLTLVNANSVDKATIYRHYPLESPNGQQISEEAIDICSLRAKKSLRQSWFSASFNFSQSNQFRQDFMQPENLLKAYCFCWSLCGKGNLPMERFKKMIQLADKKKIWSYTDLELWMIPYMLLTLCDFPHKKGFDFHFILHKGNKKRLSVQELFQSNSELQKIFANGELMAKSPNNPLPISETQYNTLTSQCCFINNQEFSDKLYQYIAK
ncbi:hypothetical protein B0187_00950 [Haemophilus paracuniculus]|uniref:Uncharacterized protein n=1 Tax=Haemophilus paracuniculus TaxID=734 RepID=A0A1T0AVJ4_9PAST|nr:hypothetical protein [Haemophilus paracuniculus]OOS00892.1 hypothetical protein B0187_00950 [Haemophilus paracuniculus]